MHFYKRCVLGMQLLPKFFRPNSFHSPKDWPTSWPASSSGLPATCRKIAWKVLATRLFGQVSACLSFGCPELPAATGILFFKQVTVLLETEFQRLILLLPVPHPLLLLGDSGVLGNSDSLWVIGESALPAGPIRSLNLPAAMSRSVALPATTGHSSAPPCAATTSSSSPPTAAVAAVSGSSTPLPSGGIAEPHYILGLFLVNISCLNSLWSNLEPEAILSLMDHFKYY